ncbi:PIN (PilT N terminus) domain-containing protein [Gordonia polyisoprenivorans VH2]|uniref:Ribonuclease VapC n=1 Tax=Gordonia polyisoprenivorans (strain DSM 44266 / VH2) TaxID=1112204 RepID=H6MV05_GORPV|nr:type II toxin-antitoxin system VapC family toxin [Gordonia polyisoprenivorans]AFA71592.1 PIN (PilT N terminus) domain-containing protein [Gordonia polyisoprenivorans VH2]
MIILDTNVISELMRSNPNELVLDWVDAAPSADVMTTAVTAAELLYGIERLAQGGKQQDLRVRVEELLIDDFRGRVLPFDLSAATHYATLVAERERIGRPISMADAQIAAICATHDADLATRNVGDFVDLGIVVINPWDPLGER